MINLSMKKVLKTQVLVLCFCLLSGCNILFPDTKVWLKKVDFQVDPKANKGTAFACHIVVPYTSGLRDRIASMDAQTYFTSIEKMEKEYKDSIQVFRYDMIPSKNKLNQIIDIKSYSKAKGAFLFAKYSAQGKFMEDVGGSVSVVVRFLPYKIEVVEANSLDDIENTIDSTINSFNPGSK